MTPNQTPTPRTEELRVRLNDFTYRENMIGELARQLERELAAEKHAKDHLDSLHKEQARQLHEIFESLNGIVQLDESAPSAIRRINNQLATALSTLAMRSVKSGEHVLLEDEVVRLREQLATNTEHAKQSDARYLKEQKEWVEQLAEEKKRAEEAELVSKRSGCLLAEVDQLRAALETAQADRLQAEYKADNLRAEVERLKGHDATDEPCDECGVNTLALLNSRASLVKIADGLKMMVDACIEMCKDDEYEHTKQICEDKLAAYAKWKEENKL